MAENAEVGSGTSFTTRSAKNLSALVYMAEDAKIDGNEDSDDETIKHIYAKNYQKLQIKLLLSQYKALILIRFYNG